MAEHVTILGAGIAGISAAYKLQSLGASFDIFEKNSSPGGLLRNFEVQGYRFDQAVHLSFADCDETRKIFNMTSAYTHSPESRCFDENLWLRHPVQNNLFPLSTEKKIEIIESFIERPEIEINNYRDWLVYQFGHILANTYPIPYTQKYWAIEPEELGVDWIGKRLHRATLEEVLRGAMTDVIDNYYYAKSMRYPKQGGYISFLDPMLKEIEVSTGMAVEQLNVSDKTITFINGQSFKYDCLINTMPLPILVEKIMDVPHSIRQKAKKLRWTKITLASCGFNKPDLPKDLWFYIYDKDILASRGYSPSIKSEDNCPGGCSSIQFEIYEPGHTTWKYDAREVQENCIYALDKMDIASQEDIDFIDVRQVSFGNVVFYKNMESDRDEIQKWLRTVDIIPAGRFGCWDYFWSHQAMRSGFNAAKESL